MYVLSILFCFLNLTYVTTKNTRNELARPVMGTIFLIIPHFFNCKFYSTSCTDPFLPPMLLMTTYQVFLLVKGLQNGSVYGKYDNINPTESAQELKWIQSNK